MDPKIENAHAAIHEAEAAEGRRLADDFKSLTVEIDHLLDLAEKNVAKVVYSTETAAESLAAQIAYFEQGAKFADVRLSAMVAEGLKKPVAYVYVVNDRQTNMIVDKYVWDSAFMREDMGNLSVMGTIASLVVLATEMMRAANAQKQPADVLCYSPNSEG